MRDVNFERLTKRAIAVYTQERAALLTGNNEALCKAAQLKEQLLTDLSTAEASIRRLQTSPASVQSRAQITSLHTIIARRTSENDQLARANQMSMQTAWP